MNMKYAIIAACLASLPYVASADGQVLNTKPDWMRLPPPHSQLHVTVRELHGEAFNGAYVSLAQIPIGYDTTLSRIADVAQFINTAAVPDGVYKSLRIYIDNERDGAITPHVLTSGTDNIINISGLIRVRQGIVTTEGMLD